MFAVSAEANIMLQLSGAYARAEVSMPVPHVVPRAAKLGLKVAGALAFLAPLLTRLVIGQAFFFTGRGKLENFDNTVSFFSGLGIPFPELNAAFVSRLEYYGGMLLIVGLLTRIVAAGLASTMVVALMTADRQSFTEALTGAGEAGLTDITAFVYLLFLVWLVVTGPGPVSLDKPLARWLGIGREGAVEPAAR
jgi:putative oxidoreductase